MHMGRLGIPLGGCLPASALAVPPDECQLLSLSANAGHDSNQASPLHTAASWGVSSKCGALPPQAAGRRAAPQSRASASPPAESLLASSLLAARSRSPPAVPPKPPRRFQGKVIQINWWDGSGFLDCNKIKLNVFVFPSERKTYAVGDFVSFLLSYDVLGRPLATDLKAVQTLERALASSLFLSGEGAPADLFGPSDEDRNGFHETLTELQPQALPPPQPQIESVPSVPCEGGAVRACCGVEGPSSSSSSMHLAAASDRSQPHTSAPPYRCSQLLRPTLRPQPKTGHGSLRGVLRSTDQGSATLPRSEDGFDAGSVRALPQSPPVLPLPMSGTRVPTAEQELLAFDHTPQANDEREEEGENHFTEPVWTNVGGSELCAVSSLPLHSPPFSPATAAASALDSQACGQNLNWSADATKPRPRRHTQPAWKTRSMPYSSAAALPQGSAVQEGCSSGKLFFDGKPGDNSEEQFSQSQIADPAFPAPRFRPSIGSCGLVQGMVCKESGLDGDSFNQSPLKVASYGTDFISLFVSGKGGCRKEYRVVMGGGRLQVACPHGCELLLETTGCAAGKLGVALHVQSDTGTFFPLSYVAVAFSGKETSESVMCKKCGKHLEIGIVCKESIPRALGPTEGYAYVACLWAEASALETLAKLIIQASVLGCSLEKHCMVKKRVLLVTKGVMQLPGAHLLHCFWRIHIVEHVEVDHRRLSRCEARFRGTFTKIQALSLYSFEKIALLDLDLLPLKNCDAMFGVPAPAAVQRGNCGVPIVGQRDSRSLFDKKGNRKGGINAGVILLHPDASVYEKIVADLKDPTSITMKSDNAPEQDYLSDFYLQEGWNTLPVMYNWQPKQMSYLVGRFGPDEEDWVVYGCGLWCTGLLE